MVHVALDNHADAADVERTILHEAVGHLGLRGDKFTIRYRVIARHLGKDNEHDLPEDVWRQLPEAIQKPFAITRYFADKKRNQQKGYRLYTALQLGNGSHVVVSAEVKNAGRDLEVNAVNTVFGRNALSNVHDELIYVSETITPDQQALLNGNNPRQYPANREFSGGKGSEKSAVPQTSEAKAGKERHPHALPERLTSEPDFHRSGEEGTEAPTAEERAMRDALSAKLREAGIEVVEDSEAGQRVLDEVNGRHENRKRKSANDTALPGDEFPFKGTVIPFADTANVRKNLDSLASDYEKIGNLSNKNVISELGKAIGAEQKGSSSQYVTIEAKNGNEVTIRLSDHNASVERMDNAGRENAISIVISRKGDKGIQGTGEARIVEYYYPDKKLRQAGGKAVAAIARSLQQTLYSGEYKDTTGLADVDVVNADRIREMRVYHGSGADFEAFDHSHMGEGEGAQAYGWGSYVAEVEGIGRAYAESSSRDRRENATVYKRRQIRDNETSINVIQGMIAEYPERQREREKRLAELEKELAGQNGQKDRIEKESGRDSVAYRNFMFYAEDIIKDTERNIARIKNDIRDEAEYNEQRKRQVSELEEENKRLQSEIEAQNPRHLYTVEIPDDTGKNYLAWEKPVPDGVDREKLWDFTLGAALSKGEHDETEREMLSGDIRDSINDAETGKDLYKAIGLYIGDREASSLLHDMGYTGISYPAEYRSGGRSDGARNYVIFKESDLKITDHVRFFRTPGGEAYGFTVGGKIYLDPRIATSETPVHEYAHLWAEALRRWRRYVPGRRRTGRG